ncbi:four helix bundle protein [Salinibacter ruber]|uniref:four helix bundle protein n=1 Tax=Salinibacter ruber TaxID=146919 RepID=UPI000DD50B2C|nr:four helix bundle protein [Salinibacter ruber]MCS3637633.1 four helix bundle protein [Salinibacter ruber]MCS3699146.1 four helix bundle protein [Salinibacter ruber]MCS3753732.1 four helix bundle protein [Salinibacter ruber]MCS4032845.1 four helix bundle protein [Salinibacter ruber]MCS4136598.1 four helix bundle protein [Salinibacter ruber]
MKNEQMTPKELEDRLIDFAVRIGNVADALPETPLGQHIADQILRSGTSPAPNYSEGCAAESRRDFAHKLGISLKELRETKTWLRIIRKADLIPAKRLHAITDETDQLCAILSQSVHTAKEKVRGR